MIETWNYASKEEERLVRRESKWNVFFCAIACLCILPIGILGIWQSYDIYAIYVEKGISFGFILSSFFCGVVICIVLLFFISYWKGYKSLKNGIVYSSQQGRVKKIWQEKDGKTVTEYYNFEYKDLVTGEIKEYKSVNFSGKSEKMKEGDALWVLASKKEEEFEIIDVLKQQGRKKLDVFWIVMDGAVLVALILARAFLYLDFGVAALYITLWMDFSLLGITASTLLYGIWERKVGAIVSALLLCGILLIIDMPASLSDIRRDMMEGPREISASANFIQRQTITRTRRGRRRSWHYKMEIASRDTAVREVEITRVAYQYYKKQMVGGSVSGKMIYYPHSKIFLYLVKDEEKS